MKKYLSNVLIFDIKDEVLHADFDKMNNYIFAICVSPKNFEL